MDHITHSCKATELWSLSPWNTKHLYWVICGELAVVVCLLLLLSPLNLQAVCLRLLLHISPFLFQLIVFIIAEEQILVQCQHCCYTHCRLDCSCLYWQKV
jgi:hypothetical protein